MIGQRFPTPSRATAAARLASQRQQQQPGANYRPGLSADISGTAYLETASVSSALSSVAGADQGATAAPVRRGQRGNNEGYVV